MLPIAVVVVDALLGKEPSAREDNAALFAEEEVALELSVLEAVALGEDRRD